MKYFINLHGEDITYIIRRSFRAKRLRIAVYHNAEVAVTLPKGKKKADAEMYLKRKAKWMIQTINSFKKLKETKQELPLKKKSIKDTHKLVEKIVKRINKKYNFSFKGLHIKSYKNKWGSCTKNNNLHFNHKINSLPKDITEYIVTHEICHLIEKNHSKRYWSLVAKTIPNYKVIAKRLQQL